LAAAAGAGERAPANGVVDQPPKAMVDALERFHEAVVSRNLCDDGSSLLDEDMASRKRHTPEQVVRKLAQADRMLGEGKDVADVCRELQVSEQTYYRWRNQFGGLKADDAKRLKDLERENATLKRLLADAELQKAALKEIARGNF
jgi:transposase-like protein